MPRIRCVVLVLASTASFVSAQTTRLGPKSHNARLRSSRVVARTQAAEVPLDNTGVTDWDYLNPRNPPYLFGIAEDALAKGQLDPAERLRLRNVLRGATPDGRTSARTPDAAALAVATHDALKEERFAELRSAAATKTSVARFASTVLEFHNRTTDRPMTAMFSIPIRNQAFRDAVLEQEEAENALSDERERLAGIRPKDPDRGNDADRNNQIQTQTEKITLAGQRAATARRRRLDVERQLGVYSRPTPPQEGLCEVIEPKSAGPTKAKDAEPTCRFVLIVPANGNSAAIPLVVIADIMKLKPESRETSIMFKVNFRGESEEPTHSTGYFSVVPLDHLIERTSASSWSLGLTVGGTFEPAIATDPADTNDPGVPDPTTTPQLRLDRPYPYAKNRLHYGSAKGSLNLNQTLGERVTADVKLTLRQKFLGGDTAKTLTVSTNSFQVDIKGVQGTRLSLGRFDIAAPSDAIAVKETGDAVQLGYDNYSLTRLIKRESAKKEPDSANQDSDVWIAQAGKIDLPEVLRLRTLSLLALRGEDKAFPVKELVDGKLKDNTRERKYWTIGGELSFGFSANKVAGTLAGYRSRLEGEFDGRGDVGWLTLTKTFSHAVSAEEGSVKVDRTISGYVGYGTGDKASTERNEGYMGETAAFAPDMVFLSSLARTIRIDKEPPGSLVGGGLSNKTYYSLAYSDETFSPLASVIAILAPGESVKGSSKVRWHHYEFNRSVSNSHNAGNEYQVQFDAKAPDGVVSTVKFGRFYPGPSLKPFFNKKPYVLTVSITVKM